MSETTETTNSYGLPQDVYDRVAAFQNEDYPGDEAFDDEAAGGDLTLTRGEAFQLRLALHAIVAEVGQSLQMEQMFGDLNEALIDKATRDLNTFLDLNDRLVAITEAREPAVA
jgi:hypothetical protein